jgi:hypothetical protein
MGAEMKKERFRKSAVKLIFILLLCGLITKNSLAWENKLTHPAITEKAIERSVLNDFLNNQLGLNDGLETQLELTGQFQNNINTRVAQEPEFEWDNKTKVSILEWLRRGSSLEDVPNPRARHHFHDPIRNAGLNNSDANQKVLNLIWLFSKLLYPDYWGFDTTGLSTLDRAKGLDGNWGNEYLNYYNWVYARSLFYAALTWESKSEREKFLGSMFVTLGHICHLLEDLGVPAHTRNDFIWGHMVGGIFTKNRPIKEGGNPFEVWMQEQIKNNGEQIPGAYLARLMDTPPAFDKLDDYWDAGICEPSGVAQWQGDSPGWPDTGFGNPPPEKDWGLAECSNYQFLSYSTIFKNSGLQSFPHPAKEHTRVDWYPTGPDGERQYYRMGYDVPHLARVNYLTFYAWLIPIYTIEIPTTEEERVFEDYAKRTIPRTIDYTTGLINYFFRGRMSVEPNWANPNIVVLTITNDSNNSGVPQVLKGGLFELYGDDRDGNRADVYDFVVAGWGPGSVLDYNDTVTATFTKPADAAAYTLVYKGDICENPSDTDPYDPNALAVAVFRPGYPVIVWGRDDYGQISGIPDTNDFIAVAAGKRHCLAIRSDGLLAGWGYDTHGECSVPPGNDYTAISAGIYHSIALKSNGEIVVWGYDNQNQITDRPDGNDFVAITAGDYHSLAIKTDGTIVGWGGYNTYGECDAPAPDTGTVYVDIAAGRYHSLALQSDGVVKAWGDNSQGQTSIYGGAAGKVHTGVAAAAYYSFLMRDDDMLISWGGDDWIEPGFPRYHYRQPDSNDFVAIAAGTDHIVALTCDGKAFDWDWPVGDFPFDYFARTVPADVVFTEDIDAGYDFSIALRLP